LSGSAVDRIGRGVPPPTTVSAVGTPIAGVIFAAAALHAGACSGFTSRPTTRIIGAVDQAARGIAQAQVFPIVVQPTGVDLVGVDVGDGGIIRAFKQEETIRRNRTIEWDVDIAAVAERPSGKIYNLCAGVYQFDPFVIGARPGS